MANEITKNDEKINQGLLKAIKAVHERVAGDNLEKSRQSQKSIGNLWKVSKGVRLEDGMIKGIPTEWVRVDRKHDPNYVILYCHGGGFFSGGLEYARSITMKLASITSMDVLSFNYRLAPEHPYPAALEDTLCIWDYLMHIGYGAKNIIVAGDSAGGNLALTLMQSLRRHNRLLPRAAVLLSPWTDLLCEGKSHETKKELDPVLSKEYLDSAIQAYAEGQDLYNPLISPLYGDYSNFPPVYIQVGDCEVLLSDSKRLYKRITQSGGYCRLDVYKGMWHVFQMSPFKKAYRAIDQVADFIYQMPR